MKMLKYISAFVILMMGTTACNEDFLEIAPEDAITQDNFFQNPEELALSTRALYNIVWFDYNDKASFCIGDGSGGNFLTGDGAMNAFLQFGLTGTNDRVNEAWKSLYNIVGQTNTLILNISSSNIDEEHKNSALAEARFMRGTAYLKLALLWGEVPIIENNLDYIYDAVVPKHTTESIYEFVIKDLEFAVENLPDVNEDGRVNAWSAKGMLARTYLYRAGLSGTRSQSDLDMAKSYAEDVVKNSGLTLMDNYEDLFKLENNNNSESLFALQWVDNHTNWGAQNTHQAYFAPEGKVTGVGDGWGGGNGATADIQALYEDADERRKATFMYKGDHYPELLQAEGGYLYDKESSAGSAIKKYVIGTREDNDGKVAFMSTSINTYMLRLSEVYLIYAEAILGDNESTTDADALMYYNAVRERAGLEAKTSITWRDIFDEKRLELAMEGHHWYDIVRWSYFDKEGVLAYLSNQNRGDFTWTDGVKTAKELFYNVTENDLTYPYPEADVIANPKLKEDAQTYTFSE